MKLKGTYVFTEQFNDAEFTDPTWSIKSVTDNYNSTCSINITLTTDSAKIGVSLGGFVYEETWGDSDIYSFVPEKLEEYKK